MRASRSAPVSNVLSTLVILLGVAFFASCTDAGELIQPDDPSESRGPGGDGGGGGSRGPGGGGEPPPPPSAGEILFKQETFGGNGRTCATCHVPPTFKINPQQIQALPEDDPIFVGKLDLAPGFVQNGLFSAPFHGPTPDDDIVVHRGIPTLFNLAGTAPYMMDGRATTLAEQINGAVLLHYHDNDLDDSPDKRMPTGQEIEDIIDFMLNLVPGDPIIPPNPDRVERGQELFFGKAQCVTCHIPPLFTDNDSHDLGLHNSSMAPNVPFDPGVCRVDPDANDCATSGRSFMTRHLVGVLHGRPYFHNNMASTLFPLLDFYSSNAFRNSPAFQRKGLEPFTLDLEEKQDLHAFLFTL